MENYGYHKRFKVLPNKTFGADGHHMYSLPPIAIKAPAALPLQWQHICAAVETKTEKGSGKEELFNRFLSDASILWPTRKRKVWLFVSVKVLTNVRKHWKLQRCFKSLPAVIWMGMNWVWKVAEFSVPAEEGAGASSATRCGLVSRELAVPKGAGQKWGQVDKSMSAEPNLHLTVGISGGNPMAYGLFLSSWLHGPAQVHEVTFPLCF